MNLPKISVVTITYGHEKYITDTLNGVLMQQYDGPVEFIIANDNSPDATDQVVKAYFEQHPVLENFEIKYTRHPVNKGMMPNFIWALEQATGKYIALCEGDDYWTNPLKLQKQVGFLEENPDIPACQHARTLKFSDHEEIQEGNEHIFTQCLVLRNNFDRHFYLNIKRTGLFNGDTFLEYYIKSTGLLGYLDFNGSVFRFDRNGVFSSLQAHQRLIKGLRSLEIILEFLEESDYPLKNGLIKQLKRHIIDYLFILSRTPNKEYTFKQYLLRMFRYKNFNLMEMKKIIKLIYTG